MKKFITLSLIILSLSIAAPIFSCDACLAWCRTSKKVAPVVPAIDSADTHFSIAIGKKNSEEDNENEETEDNSERIEITLLDNKEEQIGFVTATINERYPTYAFIGIIEITNPAHRKHGCGTKLLREMIEQLRRKGCTNITLKAHDYETPMNKMKKKRQETKRLISYYKKFGFTVLRHDVKNAEALMQLITTALPPLEIQDDEKKLSAIPEVSSHIVHDSTIKPAESFLTIDG